MPSVNLLPDDTRLIQDLVRRLESLERRARPGAERVDMTAPRQYSRLSVSRVAGSGDPAQSIPSGPETYLTMVRGELVDQSSASSSTTTLDNGIFSWSNADATKAVVGQKVLVNLIVEVEVSWASPDAAAALLYTVTIRANGSRHTTQRLRLPRVEQTIVSYGGFVVTPDVAFEATIQQDSGVSMNVTGAQLILCTWP